MTKHTRAQTIAERVFTAYYKNPNSIYWLEVAKNLDPNGSGYLDKETRIIHFSYTDGSRLSIDAKRPTMKLQLVSTTTH